jgi:hypothetical protein
MSASMRVMTAIGVAHSRASGDGVLDIANKRSAAPPGDLKTAPLKERTIDAIRRALEAAGVEFTNGERPGVRLRKER